MTRDDILLLAQACLPRSQFAYQLPREDDWRALEEHVGMRFPDEFVHFVEILSNFEFPGEFLNVAESELSNGNDSIARVYDAEDGLPEWFVPFLSIGNGDFFGFDVRSSELPGIWYWYHEQDSAKKYSGSFEQWLKGLPEFLAGSS